MKRAIILLLSLLLALTLTSCSSKKYSDGISCRELSESLIGDDTEDYSRYGEDYLDFFFDGAALCDDFEIIYSTEVNDIDELGIFHLAEGSDPEELSALAESYLSEMREGKSAFIGSYAPEELPKLERAEVRRFGNYVIYAIMDSEDRAEVFRKIEERLLA
ncbi:MAG: DUF4358 domain-containing protein [Ruminococcaceae bacterium]|nr:DUF4358 domain-containing protein [Oscillospiraceae bacterium]